MVLSDYTSPYEVRAVLGISAKEVTDIAITSSVNLVMVMEALRGLSLTLSDDFVVARDASPRSALQSRFVLLVQTYCAYVVAITLLPSLPMSAPMLIGDGKTALNRVADPYALLAPALNASLEYFKTNLTSAYSDLNPAITRIVPKRRTIAVDVPLAVDPVTGA